MQRGLQFAFPLFADHPPHTHLPVVMVIGAHLCRAVEPSCTTPAPRACLSQIEALPSPRLAAAGALSLRSFLATLVVHVPRVELVAIEPKLRMATNATLIGAPLARCCSWRTACSIYVLTNVS